MTWHGSHFPHFFPILREMPTYCTHETMGGRCPFFVSIVSMNTSMLLLYWQLTPLLSPFSTAYCCWGCKSRGVFLIFTTAKQQGCFVDSCQNDLTFPYTSNLCQSPNNNMRLHYNSVPSDLRGKRSTTVSAPHFQHVCNAVQFAKKKSVPCPTNNLVS